MSFASERPRAFEGVPTAGAAIAVGILAFVLVDVLAFYAALYRPLLDPSSTAGAFEGAIARLRAERGDSRHLYIPLGGNRGGLAATLRILMLTMLLGGLWHGAQWTFVAWGAYHGVLLCLERLIGLGRAGDEPRGVLYLVRVAATFVAVSLGWVLFRAPGFATAGLVYRELFTGGWQGWSLTGWQVELGAGLVLFAFARIASSRLRVNFSWNTIPFAARAGALAALLIALELFSWPGAPATFIYFKF